MNHELYGCLVYVAIVVVWAFLICWHPIKRRHKFPCKCGGVKKYLFYEEGSYYYKCERCREKIIYCCGEIIS